MKPGLAVAQVGSELLDVAGSLPFSIAAEVPVAVASAVPVKASRLIRNVDDETATFRVEVVFQRPLEAGPDRGEGLLTFLRELFSRHCEAHSIAKTSPPSLAELGCEAVDGAQPYLCTFQCPESRVPSTALPTKKTFVDAQNASKFSTLKEAKPVQFLQFRAFLDAVEAGRIDINAADADGRTLLHLACDVGDLIGADVTMGPRAQSQKTAGTLMLLLEMGANPLLCDRLGRRPTDIALANPLSLLGLAFLRYCLLYEPKIDMKLPRLAEPFFEIALQDHDRCLQCAVSSSRKEVVFFLTKLRNSIRMVDMLTGAGHQIYCPPGGKDEAYRFLVIPMDPCIPQSYNSDLLLCSNGTLLLITHGAEPAVASIQTPIRFLICDGELRGLAAYFRYGHQLILTRRVRARRLGAANLATAYIDELEQEISYVQSVIAHNEQLAVPEDKVSFAASTLLYPYGTGTQLANSKKTSLEPDPEPVEPEKEERKLPIGLLAVVTGPATQIQQSATWMDAAEVPRMVVLRLPLYLLPPHSHCDARTVLMAFGEMILGAWAKAHGTDGDKEPAGVGRYAEGYMQELLEADNEALFSLTDGDQDSILCFSSFAQCYRFDVHRRCFASIRVPHPSFPVAAAFAGACTLAARGQAYVLMGGDGAFVMSWPQCQLTMFMQDDDPDGCTLAACVYPGRPHIGVVTFDSSLCIVDVQRGTFRMAALMVLGNAEMAQKRADGDVDPTEGEEVNHPLSGDQFLQFSHDGKYLLRFNQLYGLVNVYRWADVEAMAESTQRMTPVFTSLLNYPYCPEWELHTRRLAMTTAIGPAGGQGTRRAIPKARLQGFLASFTTKKDTTRPTISLRALKSQFTGMMTGIQEGQMPANFRDADGRTALHLLATNHHQYDDLQLREVVSTLLDRGANLFCCDHAGLRPVDLLLPSLEQEDMTVSTPPLSQVGRALVRYRMLQEDSQLGRSSMLTLRPLAELGEHCNQVAFSASHEGVVFFWSQKYAAVMMLEVSNGESFPITSAPLPSDFRFTVLPYCPAVQGPEGNADYLLCSDGTLIEVSYVNGVEEEPQVRATPTGMVFVTSPGRPNGFIAKLQWLPQAFQVAAGDSAASKEFAMGLLVIVRPGQAAVEVFRLSSVLHNGWPDAFSYLARTLAYALGDGPMQSFPMPPLALPVQAASVAPCGVVCYFEHAPSVIYLHNGLTSMLDPDGTSLWLPIEGVLGSPPVWSPAPPAGCGCAATLCNGMYFFALFGKGVDLFTVRPLPMPVEPTEGGELPQPAEVELQPPALQHLMSLLPGDKDAELCTGAFHPTQSQLLMFLKEGELCVIDVLAEVCQVLHNLTLSHLELAQKAADGDDDNDDGMAGTQLLNFSWQGLVLHRHNLLYESFTLYAWEDVETTLAAIDTGRVEHTTYAFLPGHLDPTARVRRPVRKEGLLGYLARLCAPEDDRAAQHAELQHLLQGLRSGMLRANFQDGQGRTPLHLLARLADDMEEAEAFRLASLLLQCGASLFVCDDDGVRPVDLLPPSLEATIRRLVAESHQQEARRNKPEFGEGRARLPPAAELPMECAQVAPSATAGHVVYVLRQIPSVDSANVIDGSAAVLTTMVELLVYDTAAGTAAALYATSYTFGLAEAAAAHPRKFGFTVCPFADWLHLPKIGGKVLSAGPVDYLLLSTGAVLFVDHSFVRGPQVWVEEGGEPFDVGLRRTALNLHLQCQDPTASCAVSWDESWLQELNQQLPPGYEQLQRVRSISVPVPIHLAGSVCFIAPPASADPGLPSTVKCLSIPPLGPSPLNRAMQLADLLRAASCVAHPVQAADDRVVTSTTGCLVCVCGGASLLVHAGPASMLVTLQGVAIDTSKGMKPVSEPLSSICCTFVLGKRYYAVFSATQMFLYSVGDLPSELALRTETKFKKPGRSHLEFFVNESAGRGPFCGQFHPKERQLLYFCRGFEMFMLDVLTKVVVTLGYGTLGPEELRLKGEDGDGPHEPWIGPQSITFTCDGKKMLRHSHLYGRAYVYDCAVFDSRIQRFGQPPDVVSNAVHLEVFPAPAPAGMAAYDELALQRVPETRLARHLRHLASAGSPTPFKLQQLTLMLEGITAGSLKCNEGDLHGRTALHLACELSTLGVPEAEAAVRFLLRVGASLYQCDRAGLRPLDVLLAHPSCPASLVRSLLAYRAQFYPFADPAQRWAPLAAPRFPAVPLAWQPPKPVVYAAASTVQPNILYFLQQDGSIVVADPYIHCVRLLLPKTAASEYGYSFVVLPPAGEEDATDMLLFASGMLVAVSLPRNLDADEVGTTRRQTCVSFLASAAALQGASPACCISWDASGSGLLACVTSDHEGLRFSAMDVSLPRRWEDVPKAGRMSYLVDALQAAWEVNGAAGYRKGLAGAVPTQGRFTVAASGTSALCLAVVDGRCFALLAHKKLPTKTAELPLKLSQTATSSVVVQSQRPFCDSVAVLSHTIDACAVLHPEGCGVRVQRQMWLSPGPHEGAEKPVYGCFHPTRPLLAFVANGHLASFDFQTGVVKFLCALEPSEDEGRAPTGSDLVGRLFFSCDGLWLMRLNVTAARLVCYRWDAIERTSSRLFNSPDMANNLVLLPARMGDVDVGALGQQLVADGAVTDPG